MDHRLFEEWLLNPEPLTSEQKRELQTHLRECPACTSLAEVNLALRMAKPASPAPGFTNRFQARLAAKRVAQRRKILWGASILAISGLGMLLWFTLPYIIWLFQSPVDLFVTWLSYVAFIAKTAQATSQAGSVILQVVAGFVPTVVWAAGFASLMFFGSLWIFMFRKGSHLREGAKTL